MDKSERLLILLKKLILEEQRSESSEEVTAVIRELDKLIVKDVIHLTEQNKV